MIKKLLQEVCGYGIAAIASFVLATQTLALVLLIPLLARTNDDNPVS